MKGEAIRRGIFKIENSTLREAASESLDRPNILESILPQADGLLGMFSSHDTRKVERSSGGQPQFKLFREYQFCHNTKFIEKVYILELVQF